MSVCVVCLDYLCRWHIHVYVYCGSEVHSVFSHVAHYEYLIPNMYLFITIS